MGRGSNIKRLKKEIEEATIEFNDLRDKMVDGGFQLDDIKTYNHKSSEIGCLKIKLDREEKYMKPQQYMEELNVPKNRF